MEDITKDFLIKNGFKEEYKNIFTFSNKEYIIDVIHREIPYHNRFWKIVIYSSTRFIVGDVLVQTMEQFNKVMEIYNVDLNNKE